MADLTALALVGRVPSQPLSSVPTIAQGPLTLPTPLRGMAAAVDGSGATYLMGGSGGSGGATVGTTQVLRFGIDGTMTTLSMPEAKTFAAAATDNAGRVYILGGYSNGSVVATVYRYDPSLQTWTALASLPLARASGAATADASGRIYYFGGSGESTYATVYRFDPATGVWTTLTSMPTVRSDLGAVAVGNTIYLTGGPDAVVYSYDVAAGTYTTLASMTAARGAHGSAADSSGRIYVLGGYVPTGTSTTAALASVERYTPGTNSWSTLTTASLITGRSSAPAVRDNTGRIGIFGGATTSGAATILTSIERLTPESSDTTAASWASIAALSTLRGEAAVSTDGTRIYASNGFNGSPLNTLEIITPTADGGSATVTTGPTDISARRYCCGTWAAGAHWAIGGTTGASSTTSLVTYYVPGTTDPAVGTWSSGTSLPGLRTAAAASTVGTYVYVAGGSTATASSAPTASTTVASVIRLNASTPTGAWESLPAMPAPRQLGALVTVGTRILYFGGYDNSTQALQTAVYAYDTAAGTTGTWTTLTAMQVGLSSLRAVAVGNIVYLMDAGSTTVYTYDARNGAWATLPQLLTTAHGPNPGLVAIGSRVYFVGGNSTGRVEAGDSSLLGTTAYARRLKALQQYLPITGLPVASWSARRIPTTITTPAWAVFGTLSAGTGAGAQQRTNDSVSSDGRNIYRTSGRAISGGATLSDGYAIAPDGTVTGLPTSGQVPRQQTGLGSFFNGKHCQIGGYNSTAGTTVSQFDAYSPLGTNGATGTWTSLAAFPTPRVYLGTAAYGGLLYGAGGATASGTFVGANDTYAYNPTTNAWTQKANSPVAAASNYHCLVTSGAYLYLIGGQTSAGNLTQIYRYDPVANVWTTMPTTLPLGGQCQAVAVGGLIYIYELSATTNYILTYNPVSGALGRAATPAVLNSGGPLTAVGNAPHLLGGDSSGTLERLDVSASVGYTAAVAATKAFIAAQL